jgi:hypothetical protein
LIAIVSKARFPPAAYSWRMYLRRAIAPRSLLGGSPAVTISAPRWARLIAPPTVLSIAAYCFAFGLLHQYWRSSGSFQIW